MVSNLNMNFSERVVIDSQQQDWVETRLPGVKRRMLDREHEESGRATSIVSYDAGSYFSPHTHEGGEEFLVLEGTFSDEHGDYGPGHYVRNPIGSSHKPFSTEGCVIFVKLWQMETDDQDYVRVDTKQTPWHPGMVDGLSVLPLHSYGFENVALVKWKPGTVFNPHVHMGGEEILVIDGVFQDEHGEYGPGCWIRSPSGSKHTPFSPQGCTIFVKTGHLG